MAPSAQTNLYTTSADIQSLLSALGVDARLDDDESGTVDTTESPFLLRCREVATAKVKRYCLPHYADDQLAQSWLANEWATVLAAHWLCSRRLNAVPDSIQALRDEAIADLEAVHADRIKIPECARRTPDDSPCHSNVNVSPWYRVKQIRVQRSISDRTPTQYPQNIDWPSEARQEI